MDHSPSHVSTIQKKHRTLGEDKILRERDPWFYFWWPSSLIKEGFYFVEPQTKIKIYNVRGDLIFSKAIWNPTLSHKQVRIFDLNQKIEDHTQDEKPTENRHSLQESYTLLAVLKIELGKSLRSKKKRMSILETPWTIFPFIEQKIYKKRYLENKGKNAQPSYQHTQKQQLLLWAPIT
jgi:hypothetical protein